MHMTIPAPIRAMLDALHQSGFDAYLVGGCVRDALLGLVPHDYDITTNARPEEITALFGEEVCTWYGKAFGTVCVRLDGGEAEVTTFRTEGGYTDGRHPGHVEFADDVHDDLSRRDFTCNAIAYDPRSGLLDPFGGAEDLQNGVLRAVGDPPARFAEDALRILRGIRFCARFSLTAEPRTDTAMRKQAETLRKISVERVFTELCGILMGEDVTRVLLAYPEVLAVWIPEISPCIGFLQHSKWHDFTVWEHIARSVGFAPRDLTVRMAMLLHDIGKPLCLTMEGETGHFKGHAQKSAQMADVILHRLHSDNHLREDVTALIDMHRITPQCMADVRHLLGKLGEVQFRRYLCVLDADRRAKWQGREQSRDAIDRAESLFAQCIEENLCCTVRQLAVNGRDAAALGFEGAQIGNALQSALEEVIAERVENTRDEILEYLKKISETGAARSPR